MRNSVSSIAHRHLLLLIVSNSAHKLQRPVNRVKCSNMYYTNLHGVGDLQICGRHLFSIAQ